MILIENFLFEKWNMVEIDEIKFVLIQQNIVKRKESLIMKKKVMDIVFLELVSYICVLI